MDEKWAIGAAAATIGSFGAGLGENLIRLSFAKHQGVEPAPPLWQRPLWVVGWVLTTVVTSVCAVVGLAHAPLQLLMPIGGLHILFGVGIAHVLSGETLGSSGLSGAALVCVGVTIVLTGVDKATPKVNFSNIGDIITRVQSVMFFIAWACCGALLLFCTRRARKQLTSLNLASLEDCSELEDDMTPVKGGQLRSSHQHHHQQQQQQQHQACQIQVNGVSADQMDRHSGANAMLSPGGRSRASSEVVQFRQMFDSMCSVIHPIAAPALSGMLSALSNLMMKLALSLASDAQWGNADKTVFGVFTLIALLAGVGQVVCLNHALANAPAVVVVPTANSVLITIGSAAGMLFSSEQSMKSALLLAVSICFVIAGIVCLAMRDMTHEGAEHTHHHHHHLVPEKHVELAEFDSPTGNESVVGDTHQVLANLSFTSCASSRSFGGYCDNISFNHHDNTEEFKRTMCELGKKIRTSVGLRSTRRGNQLHAVHDWSAQCSPYGSERAIMSPSNGAVLRSASVNSHTSTSRNHRE
eukprot:TRINITY_DN15972_c0_g1_i1.p1 TRINITY_DN15972_c0_g1~~TRINITY_DN15972_c0_g1_i1.p1  ORF type:complete len:526 (+),score=150.11 TRINITY_DN15972_c0_g1_i1:118-1695(+)